MNGWTLDPQARKALGIAARTERALSFGGALAAAATVALLASACGSVEPPPEDEDTAVGEDSNADNDGTLDVATGSDADAATGGSDGDAGSADTGADVADDTGNDVAVADADGGGEVAIGDAEGDGDAAADTAAEDVPPPKKLPLPSCAQSCNDCAKCDDTPMCVNGKSFNNDCEAICEFEAYDWPTGYEPSQGKCPECSFCSPDDTPDGFGYCATLKNGAKITVEMLCETKCLDLATDAGVNPTKGPCKSKCSFTPDNGGGGCSMTAWQPVCSKKDGATYQTTCAMQNCDLQGCFGLGEAAATNECEPGKMVVECPGECYDATKWAACPKDCAPVCAVAKTGKGVSYRNGCVANTEGAKVLSCTGVSATSKDQCSATLYATAASGCCPDVDYSDKGIKQVCYSKGQGTGAQWMTFRNKTEFDCLVTDDKASWTFQYAGPCICDCPQTEKVVCGDDGIEYQNACQAKCYNGESFSWKDGPC